MSRVTKGVDISTYNTNIDYANMARQIDYAILRCGFTGYGPGKSLNKDAQFENHYAGFSKQGLPMGVYYYSCAATMTEAIKEAKYVLDLVKGKKFLYPIYIDVEDSYHMQKLSKKELSEVVLAFCRTIENSGYYTGIYANTYWWNNEIDQTILADIDKWVAHYKVQTPGVQGDMWQYTETGKLNGHTGDLDLNYCYKDYPAIIKAAGLNGYGEPKESSKITIRGVIERDDEKVKLAQTFLAVLGFTVTVEGV